MVLNFFSELILIYSMMKFSLIFIIMMLFLMVLSVAYSLILYTRVGHGMMWLVNYFNLINLKNFLIIFMHTFFLFFYIFMSNFFLYEFI